MVGATDRKQVHPKTRAEWRRWLEKNHDSSPGVWFVSYKKTTGKPRVEYEDAVEEGLCFGWVDSQARSLDDERSMLMFTPRKPTSGWSKTNKDRVARLIKDKKMTRAGLEAIAVAKKNGSWTALDSVEALEAPPDLRKALAANTKAKKNYEGFPPSSKKIILAWIATAKRPETREKRIGETVRLAGQNVRANHREERR